MRELELKFQVQAAQVAPLVAWLRAQAPQQGRAMGLRATYWDTPGRDLTAAGLALRVRREGRHWVQTLKGLGPDALTRLEHNVTRRERAAQAPAVDPALHRGTPVGERLAQVLADAAAAIRQRAPVDKPDTDADADADADADPAHPLLQSLFQTDIRRRRWQLTGPWGAVEMALDQGRITAGDAALPVCELEIELLHGSAAAVFDAALQVLAQVPVWLDLRTKAERGDRLARGLKQVPAFKSVSLRLPRRADVLQASRVVLGSTLAQAMANAQEIAGGLGTPEHLHQLRVALRRSRTALRLFHGALPFDLGAWQSEAAWLFGQTGRARDQDALGEALVPALKAAGAPLVAFPPPEGESIDMMALLRSRPVQELWLQWLAYAHGLTPPAASPEPAAGVLGEVTPAAPAPAPALPAAREWMHERLRRWGRAVRRDARVFDTLDEPSWHRLRKRVKRLRYAAEFASSGYPKRAVAATLKDMARLQDAMGELNDVLTAMALFQDSARKDPRALFALGWLAAQRDVLRRRTGRRLREWTGKRPFWREGG